MSTTIKKLVAFAALLNSVLVCPCMAQQIPTTNVRAIVERSLPYIQSGGMSWRNDQKCVSCHTTTFTAWALNRAVENGFEVEEVAANDWNEWSREWGNHVAVKRRDQAKRDETLLAENDSVGQLLLGRPSAEETSADWVVEYRSFLAKSQNKDGSWKAGGQLPLQKRPKRETQEVSTMWALVALADSNTPEDVWQQATTAAEKWLGDKTEGVSIEWWSTRLLIQHMSEDSELAAVTREKILKLQNQDGGWGWLIEDHSDALGTGIVLYALGRSGLGASDDAVVRACKFLEQSQDEDGSWQVKGTKKNSADDVTDTASYWGTCWAVISLTEFLRQPSSTAKID